jgi:uncharacterized SAM-binding protein YcdF (DUF218 family)
MVRVCQAPSNGGTYPDAMKAPAVVVLGTSIARAHGRLVAEAERAARRHGAEVVVFTGWSSGGTGPSEAARMRTLWRGPDGVELVVEETASTTAENAARTLPLLVERGATAAIVISTPLHLLRARLIFRSVFGARGISVRVRAARVAPTPGALLWELGAFTVVGRQVRAARSEHERA